MNAQITTERGTRLNVKTVEGIVVLSINGELADLTPGECRMLGVALSSAGKEVKSGKPKKKEPEPQPA